jgi:hypothetical protein
MEVNALKRVNGTQYRHGSIANIIEGTINKIFIVKNLVYFEFNFEAYNLFYNRYCFLR